MWTPILLIISNIFMTLAWYGHLKFEHVALPIVIVVSWAIALLEYAFQVPANRLGAKRYSVTQLKIMQECITLAVFSVIAFLLFGQKMTTNTMISYGLIVGAVYFAFSGEKAPHEHPTTPTDTTPTDEPETSPVTPANA